MPRAQGFSRLGKLVLATLLVTLSTRSATAGTRWACAGALADESAGSGGTINRGPCLTPDAVDYFATGPGGHGLVVTNFGLLTPGDRLASWQVVCDDNFGFAPATQVRLHPDGRIFAASTLGLYFSSDTCVWSRAGGDIASKIVLDVAFDRQATNIALALGDIPRKLWRSTDGGQTFTLEREFAPSASFHRLVIAPSDGQHVYLVGRGQGAATPFARSADGGKSFEIGDLTAGVTPPPANALEFVAIAPDDPLVLYFSVINPMFGDELWRTTDGGVTVTRVLQLTPGDALSGFDFGADTETLFVAGSDTFPVLERPPGRLHVSHDGGRTWAAPLASGPTGPRYRCLRWSPGGLYACGAGEPGGDAFLIGVSSDEGKTWSPAVRLDQLAGARSCVAARCVQTEEWLCDNYCSCAPGGPPSRGSCAAAADGGAPVEPGAPTAAEARDGGPIGRDGGGPGCTGTGCLEKQGCSCHLGSSSGSFRPPGFALILLALLAIGRRRRVHDRTR